MTLRSLLGVKHQVSVYMHLFSIFPPTHSPPPTHPELSRFHPHGPHRLYMHFHQLIFLSVHFLFHLITHFSIFFLICIYRYSVHPLDFPPVCIISIMLHHVLLTNDLHAPPFDHELFPSPPLLCATCLPFCSFIHPQSPRRLPVLRCQGDILGTLVHPQ